MRKATICICENKDADQLCNNCTADQLCSNCTADQRLCFRHTDSTIPLILIQSFKLLAKFCDCTAWFVSDLVGNPNCWFSHAQALMFLDLVKYHGEILPSWRHCRQAL